MNPQYARSDLVTKIELKAHGTLSSTTADAVVNESARIVAGDVDLYSMKRKVRLSLDGRNAIVSEARQGTYEADMLSDISDEMDLYYFHCPDDLKGESIIDIQKRATKIKQYEITTAEEFQRRKTDFDEQVAVYRHGFMSQLLVSGIDEIDTQMIHNCDTYDGDGTWAVDGASITAIATETDNYAEGAGAINFTTATGAITGGTITVDDMTAVDVSDYEDHDVYVWLYIPMATGLTSLTLKWGSSSAAYFSRTITRTHDGNVFHVGWNLLRFPWADATETGTVDEENVDYIQLAMTKGASNTGTTGWIMDRIIACKDSEHDVVYYSKYPWQNTSADYLAESTSDTDLINADEDELELHILKGVELYSLALGDDEGEAKYNGMYDVKIKEYKAKYPSEALVLSTTYYGVI